MQAHDVEPMQEIGAEFAARHFRFEILMRRRDDAHGRALHGVAADAVILAVGQHAQKAHLQVEWHVADLVEEQRAAFRLLESAAAHRLRARERAALVAEELGLEQFRGNGRRVQCDERFCLARAVLVQRTRHQFLAGAGFTRDQHGDARARKPADGAEHLLHRRRLA